MLKNAYLLAKIGADTAENERNCAEVAALPDAMMRRSPPASPGVPPAGAIPRGAIPRGAASKQLSKLRRRINISGGLVLGCIEAKFFKKICV